MALRHFLTLNDCTPEELQHIIHRAIEMKKQLANIRQQQPFKGYVMGMLFEKSSTRTRVSFEAGMAQLGGHAMFLSPRDTQLGRGEPIADSSIVLSSMLDIIMIRTFGHERLVEFAKHSSVPVINALTDGYHPCQLLADMQTYQEHRGSIQGKKVAWIGDGNNMCQSYMLAAAQFDFELAIACPPGYEPDKALLEAHADRVTVTHDAEYAAQNADLLVTDVWASMGQEDEQKARETAFASFQINEALMDIANDGALFMHCLPAHRGEEISENMLDHPSSVAWDEAENRLHAQKALVEFLLLENAKG
ncbi:Ornithine carbamoyltransferase, anabolic [BD1-7 clade bacterium]|uniref:Ornithine carbamoyltransferase n=1 Tax=BD1-7 clade bacterium TaxID=2029982 RepID=A0A5S9QYK0_9GAMM|nr:Ornithine carbamoyltransferase, anabolic [BD1-7 clade bacterium]